MEINKHKPLIKPSDARSWSLCERRVWLDNKGEFEITPIKDEFEQLIVKLGVEHESTVLKNLTTAFDVQIATSAEHTKQLMDEGVEVIYQAQLFDQYNGLTGYPDFLILHESGKYQAADAKLSLSEDKKEIQIQLGFYRKMLNSKLPGIVFLGDGSEAFIGDEANEKTNQFITAMRELLANDQEPKVRYSHSKCRACPFYSHCKPAFESKEELSLLYGVDGRAVPGLEAQGIDTITKLSESDPFNIPDIPYFKGNEKKQRAVLQAKSYLTNEVFQISPISLPEGDWVHFDIEDNPLADIAGKHVYLWGFLVPDYNQDNFEYVWTDHESEDQHGWLSFLAKIEEFRVRYPSLILAHYSSHEHSTIRSYANRYEMEDNATVKYLLDENSPLFDIRKPILQSLVLPLQGYGLKDICKPKDLVNFQWEDDDSGSQWSVVQFNHFLAETNPQTKAKLKSDILGYNRDDVIATLRLEEWLRKRF